MNVSIMWTHMTGNYGEVCDLSELDDSLDLNPSERKTDDSTKSF